MRSPKNQSLLGWLAVGGLSLAAGRIYYEQLIHPVREQEIATQRSVAALQSHVADARRVVGEFRALETQRRLEHEELRASLADLPAGSALVWFPERMKKHFARSGGGEVVTRLNTALDETELPGFERTYWAVEMPAEKTSDETRELCLSIAALEPLDPSVRVLDAAIRPDADDPTRRVAVVNVSVLAPRVGGR